MNNTPDLWLVGCGTMAIEYTKILVKLRKKFEVVGRGKDSAKFLLIQPHSVIRGVFTALEKVRLLILVLQFQLKNLKRTTTLLDYGVKNILIENLVLYMSKNSKELEIRKRQLRKIDIAYNRRFYESADPQRFY